jgi:hypothetical protein
MAPVEAGQTINQKAFPPKSHRVNAATQIPRDRSLALALGQTEDNIRSPHIFGRQTAATQPSLEF